MEDTEKITRSIEEKNTATFEADEAKHDTDSVPSSSQGITISPKEYRKLIWKLDSHLLPPLFFLWAFSLIDRVNIGAAKIQGLEKDLRMDPTGNQFNIALIVIFAGLITCEIPSNWLMRKVRPSLVLCTETFCLGQ
jgi:hypothetical protein